MAVDTLVLGADGWDCSLLYAVHQMLSLFFPLQPQSTGLLATTEGGGDATSRQDTRQDRGLFF